MVAGSVFSQFNYDYNDFLNENNRKCNLREDSIQKRIHFLILSTKEIWERRINLQPGLGVRHMNILFPYALLMKSSVTEFTYSNYLLHHSTWEWRLLTQSSWSLPLEPSSLSWNMCQLILCFRVLTSLQSKCPLPGQQSPIGSNSEESFLSSLLLLSFSFYWEVHYLGCVLGLFNYNNELVDTMWCTNSSPLSLKRIQWSWCHAVTCQQNYKVKKKLSVCYIWTTLRKELVVCGSSFG